MNSDEVLISFAEAARILPRKVHPGTIGRWADIGLGGIKLWNRWQGGRRFTTAEALASFVAAAESRRYLQDQVHRESFERELAEKFGLTNSKAKRPAGPGKVADRDTSD